MIPNFEKAAPFLSNPLVLIGFCVLLFFSLLKLLIKARIFPQVAQTTAGRLITDSLRYGFWLATLVIVLGFSLEALKTYRSQALSEPDDSLEAKNAVRELKTQIISLRGVYESVQDYGEPAALKVRTQGPKLARRMLAIADRNLDEGFQLIKYAFSGCSLVLATQAELSVDAAIDDAQRAVVSIDRSLALISEIRAAADGSNPYYSDLASWIDDQDLENWSRYNRAIALAAQSRLGVGVQWSAIEEELQRIEPSYLVRFPIDRNKELAWACNSVSGAKRKYC